MLLSIKNLRACYEKALVLDDISLELTEGTFSVVVGPNGAGKTTLLKVINGLLKPAGGSITFNGEEISGLPVHKIAERGIMHCPEGRRVFGEMTVLDNLVVGGLILKNKLNLAKQLETVYHLFPRLAERKKQLVGTMSGGEQQMVAIGRAFMAKPKLLMLDEPSMGLAPMVVEEIFERIGMIKSSGTTVLLVEQNVDAALSVADYIAILDQGNLVGVGPVSELCSNSRLKEIYLGI